MKRIFTLVLLVISFTLNAQLTEDFTASGAVLGYNGWSATAAVAGTPAISTTTGLTYSGFMGSGIGNAVALGAVGEDLTKNLPAVVTAGKLYMSFMINVSASTATQDYITGFTSGGPTYFTNYNLRVYVKSSGAGFDLGVSRGSVTTVPATPAVFTGGTLTYGQTYLVTCRYEWISPGTADDVCSIYIHPVGTVTTVEPASMSASQSGSSGLTDGTISAIYLRQGAALNGVVCVIDGFRVANSWLATLPIELTSFNASTKNATTKLTWQTASEKNNSHFAVERSQNGETFSALGEVKGNGNSVTTRDYQFTDATPYKGVNYYRLRQVDFDGTESVSKTVSVNFDGSGRNKMKAYPTLVQDNLTVEVEGDAKSEITVRDLTGRVILTKNTEGPSAQVLNMSGLSNGMYLLSVRSNDALETVKITKQ
jgi:hypothetical protein